jgi:hypothetical protein
MRSVSERKRAPKASIRSDPLEPPRPILERARQPVELVDRDDIAGTQRIEHRADSGEPRLGRDGFCSLLMPA